MISAANRARARRWEGLLFAHPHPHSRENRFQTGEKSAGFVETARLDVL